jgi:uncharacterized protein YjaZ
MEIIIQDTYKLYKEMLNLPEEKRGDFFSNKFMEPFDPMFEIMHMPKTPEALACIPLTGNDAEIVDMLNILEKADAWNNARKTIEIAAERFRNAGVAIPEKVIVGIFLGNPVALSQNEGYTGVGSIPGYIQIVIAPNEKNLLKLNSCIAHEFHHNVLFHNATWNFMNVSVGKYLAVEGLAESFAASLFGDEFIGPWVTGVQGEDLEKSRGIISNALDVQGFMEVRKYIFGAHPMVPGSEALGIPYCGGYAVGYHAVQAFIRKTGISIEKATILDGDEIMRLSGYFNI